MNLKELRIKRPTSKKLIKLMNGIFDLTNKEIDILASFLDHQKKYPEFNVFSTEIKKQIASELGISNTNTMNVHIKNLKGKRAIIPHNGTYKIHKLFNVDQKEGIAFIWNQ